MKKRARNEPGSRNGKTKRLTISALPVLVVVVFSAPGLSQDEDLEKDFLREETGMERDYQDFERAAFEEFRREVQAMWGDFVISTKKDWVEYSPDKAARSRVDFKEGEAVVEVILPKDEAEGNPALLEKRLAKEVEALVVNNGKKRDYPVPAQPARYQPPALEKTKPETPPQALLPTPVLEGQLQDKAGNPVTDQNKEAFALEIVKTQPVSKEAVRTEEGEKIKVQVKFPLVPDHLRIRAQRYHDPVREQAGRFSVSVPLAFAVIHTESYFNPKATSPIPAYGLMQLVPKSGARDAYRRVYGKDRILPADYLYHPENNIELGCAYLGLLQHSYFGKVRNPRNALYCVVASYNGGAGNTSQALCGKKVLSCAVERVNDMEPEALYTLLQARLPYDETKDYLKKVTERMDLYREWE